MKILYLILLFCSNLVLYAQNWVQLDDFPGTARDDAASFTIGDSTYIGTGLAPWWSELDDFYGFDHQSETWFQIASLPSGQERQYASGFSGNGKGYVFGGIRAGQFLADLWEYDPDLNQWSNKTSIPADPRSGTASFVIGDTAYIVGGKTATADAIAEFWAYCISQDTWTQKNDLPMGALWRASATSNDTSAQIVFGADENNNFNPVMYGYFPAVDAWLPSATYANLGRTHGSVVYNNGSFFAMFGSDSNNVFYSDIKRLDGVNIWTNMPDLPSTARRGGIVFSNGDEIIYSTGLDSTLNRTKETWKLSFHTQLDELSFDELMVYPNPTTGKLNLNYQSSQEIEYHILDISGKLILKKATNSSEIDVSNLESGFYYLYSVIDGKLFFFKFCKN